MKTLNELIQEHWKLEEAKGDLLHTIKENDIAVVKTLIDQKMYHCFQVKWSSLRTTAKPS